MGYSEAIKIEDGLDDLGHDILSLSFHKALVFRLFDAFEEVVRRAARIAGLWNV